LRDDPPEGLLPLLLDYLGYADGDEVRGEIARTALVVGVKEGKVDARLTAALKDGSAFRRAAAALVVGRHRTEAQRHDVRDLLKDADAAVRFQAARGLLGARDKAAVPVLIALLADGPPDLSDQADDLLCCVAGAKAPRRKLDDKDDNPLRYRDAWA